jgi:hypothetical protein
VNTALDQFETSLVHASQTLHRRGPTHARRPSRLAGGLRRNRWRVPAGALVVGALVAAGTSLLGPTGNPRTITSLECGSDTIVASVTDDPVRDCATRWPSLHHQPAPRLTAWVAETGGAVVVIRAGTPPPAGHWRRLPGGWRADAAVIQLNDQLQDITTGLAARSCWSAPAASALVDSILLTDGLSGWHVGVKLEPAEGAHPNCLLVDSSIAAQDHAVRLIERRVQAPASGSFMTTGAQMNRARFSAVEGEVNRTLSAPAGHCASVAQAAGLWRARAHAAGLGAGSYVMFAPPPEPRATARCARVTVMAPGGGGPYDVYVAEVP